jgi:hypothetical protein
MLASISFRDPLAVILAGIRNDILTEYYGQSRQLGRLCNQWAGMALSCRAIAAACKAAGLGRRWFDDFDIVRLKLQLQPQLHRTEDLNIVDFINLKEGIHVEYLGRQYVTVVAYSDSSNKNGFHCLSVKMDGIDLKIDLRLAAITKYNYEWRLTSTIPPNIVEVLFDNVDLRGKFNNWITADKLTDVVEVMLSGNADLRRLFDLIEPILRQSGLFNLTFGKTVETSIFNSLPVEETIAKIAARYASAYNLTIDENA